MLDLDGRIISVNDAWMQFGRSNGLRRDYTFEGKSYLDITAAAAEAGDPFARDALAGLIDVIHTGRQKFVLSYPCHGPGEKRWFKLWVEPQMPHLPVIIVAHQLTRQDVMASLPGERWLPTEAFR